MRIKPLLLVVLSLVLFIHCGPGKSAKPDPNQLCDSSQSAMVVTAHPQASMAALQVLKKGGNAIDAAIAAQFALAVVYPQAGNIGGGGF